MDVREIIEKKKQCILPWDNIPKRYRKNTLNKINKHDRLIGKLN